MCGRLPEQVNTQYATMSVFYKVVKRCDERVVGSLTLCCKFPRGCARKEVVNIWWRYGQDCGVSLLVTHGVHASCGWGLDGQILCMYLEPNSTTRTPATNTGYGHQQRRSSQQFCNKFATSQCQSPTSRHVKMLGCGKFVSVGGVRWWRS